MVNINDYELNQYKCLWKIISENEQSTTFRDVNKNSDLYRCKHECTGYGFFRNNTTWHECSFYKPLIKYKKEIKKFL